MTDPAEWKDDFPVEASIPDGIASLDSILCTDELRRRAWRPPDYEKENRALVALASALADRSLISSRHWPRQFWRSHNATHQA